MRYIIIGLVIIVLLWSTRAAGISPDSIQPNLVYVVNDKALGSGIIADDGIVVTCAHLVPKDKKVQVYNAPTPYDKHNQMAQVLYLNKETDVAILSVPWAKGQVKWAYPFLGEKVVEIGYTNGELFYFEGHICQIQPAVLADMHASFGASGSGVYDANTGELVGMVKYLRILGPVGAPVVVGITPSGVIQDALKNVNAH